MYCICQINNHIIVTDHFDDKVFDCFHNKNQCHIIGPLVITYCDDEFCPFSHCSLPKRTWPIYSLCMRGLEVTTSHMPIDKRQFIEKRVQLMSGCYHEDLNTNTSVLVSDSVLTKKSTYSCDKPHIYRDNRMDRIMLGQIST